MKSFFTRRRVIIALVIILLLVVGYFVFHHDHSSDLQTQTVTPGDFVQQVSVSGKVVASESVDLSFSESGRVVSVPVAVGDQVALGQTLASLTTSELAAQLASAQADLQLEQAQTANTVVNLDEVRKQQDTLVAGAYRQLLSGGLVATPSNQQTGATAPVISGSYLGGEGTYKVIIDTDNTQPNTFSLRTFGIEDSPQVDISKTGPTPLGTHGLYLSFPDNLNNYNQTIWYVAIPNQTSPDYLDNFNRYQEALRTRDKEIADAAAELAQGRSESTVSQAQLQQAQAKVDQIQAQIAERSIRAPFAGVITAVPAKVGSIANANDPALSMISAGTLELESYVPEINVPYLKVGDSAVVTLDAYGSDVPFAAKVISIDPAETVRDGVSTYRAKLAFTTQDERIKSGMTASIVITTEQKSQVISIPQGVVIEREGKKFVPVQVAGQTVEREVTVGSVSSLGEIEIVSGLEAGDQVVVASSTP